MNKIEHAIVFVIVLMIVSIFLVPWLVQWGWNYFLHGMAGMPVIGYWPAFGLWIIISLTLSAIGAALRARAT